MGTKPDSKVSLGILFIKPQKNVWWQCGNMHEWRAAVKDRTRNKRATNCPECSRRRKKLDSQQLLRANLND